METKNNILLQDIQQVVRSVDLSELKNSSIFVTGATGLLGSFIIRVLLYLNKTENYNVQIFALIRNKEKAEKIFWEYSHNDNINWIIGDIRNFSIKENIDYIIHGASVTSSQDFLHKPVETISTALYGTERILETSKELKVKSVVYLSSMEVFGITDTRLEEVKENDYGYIDILNPRSSYSEGKRMCECLCAGYAAEYDVPVKIARLTQTLGAGINYNDMRVAAQFMRSVIENKDIVLKTEGKTRRPIVYISDAISGILTVLLKGKNGESYTIANRNTVATIRETAEMIAHTIAKDKIKVVFDIDVPKEYAPNLNLNLNLNTDKLESLGWKACVGLEDAYRRMIENANGV